MWVSARVPSLSLPRLAQDLSRQMQEQMFAQTVLDGPVALHCQVTVAKHRHGVFATRPPSLSELARAIEACLRGIVFTSPAQVVRLSLSKAYGEKPGIEVTVEHLAAEDAQRPETGCSAEVRERVDRFTEESDGDRDAEDLAEALVDGA